MAGPLDEAYVEITGQLDTRQMERAVNTAGRVIEKNLTDSVKRAEASMTRAGAKLGDNVGKTISDSTGQALGDGLRRNASGRLVDAQGRFISAAKASGEAIGDSLADGIGDGLDNGFKRDINGKLRDNLGRFVDDGGRQGRRFGDTFGGGLSSGLSQSLSSLSSIKLPVAGFAVLGAALASAAATAAQLAAALAPAVGIIAALPSGIGVLAAGMSTLNVATMGVGDAFGAAFGDAEEFEEAMEGLAPAVQEAAQALRDMAPQLDELRDKVQGAFFQDFDDVLNALAETLMGPVTTGMVAVATEINGLITGLTGVATSAEGVDFVTQSFAIMANIIAQLQEPLILLFSSLLNVGTAINEAFGESAGSGLADMITQFALFLDQAAATGQATQWITDAMAVFSAIGDILSPIGGIIMSIGEAASATGGNILGVWGEALQVFDDFLNSAAGQATLISMFEALNNVGATFRAVLSGIGPALPPLISGLGNILGVVAPLLGPLSQLVGSVLTALAPILTVVAAAIAPIIGPLSTVVELLSGVLVQAINAVMPLIVILGEVIGGVLGVAIEALAPILTVLIEALSPIIEALTPLFEILGLVAELIGAVVGPVIQVLGDILLWIVDTIIVPILVPAIEVLAEVLSVILTAAIEYLVQYFKDAWEGLGILFEWLKENATNAIDAIVVVWNALSAAFKAGYDFVKRNTFEPMKNGFNALQNVATTMIVKMRVAWDNFVGFIKGIPGKVKSSLSVIFSPLWDGFKGAINNVISGWNNLSFTMPSVDLGPLGSTPSFTVSTPNIPMLADGALATGPTLAMIGEGQHPEALLPLGDSRVDDLLASALSRAGMMGGDGASAGAVAATSSAQGIGDMHFSVRIGDRELNDIIVEQIDESNRVMLRRARARTRRNG